MTPCCPSGTSTGTALKPLVDFSGGLRACAGCLPNHLGQAELILDSGILSGVILSGGGNVARSRSMFWPVTELKISFWPERKRRGFRSWGLPGVAKLCHAFGGTLVKRAGHTVTSIGLRATGGALREFLS